MAWHAGNFFLAPGATTRIRFWWGTGVDHGPQWALPHPFPGQPDVWLVTERVGKRLICEIGVVTQNGPANYGCGGTGSSYEYAVWIKNDGGAGCRYELQGGGV
jgi:hypothetical protein